MKSKKTEMWAAIGLFIFSGSLALPSDGWSQSPAPATATVKMGADLSGVYYPSTSKDTLGAATPDNPGQQFVWLDDSGMPIPFPKNLLTEWGKERMAKNHPSGVNSAGQTTTAYNSDDPDFSCFPAGVPRIYLFLYPMQILNTKDGIMMVFEYAHNIRQIFTDGRGHARDQEPTWMGDSIGHWEGGTLVVETTNQNDRTWFGYGGQPHSDQLKVEERMRKTDPGTLLIDITLMDPKAYTAPLHTRKKYILKPSWNLKEYVCEDNLINFRPFEKETSIKSQ